MTRPLPGSTSQRRDASRSAAALHGERGSGSAAQSIGLLKLFGVVALALVLLASTVVAPGVGDLFTSTITAAAPEAAGAASGSAAALEDPAGAPAATGQGSRLLAEGLEANGLEADGLEADGLGAGDPQAEPPAMSLVEQDEASAGSGAPSVASLQLTGGLLDGTSMFGGSALDLTRAPLPRAGANVVAEPEPLGIGGPGEDFSYLPDEHDTEPDLGRLLEGARPAPGVTLDALLDGLDPTSTPPRDLLTERLDAVTVVARGPDAGDDDRWRQLLPGLDDVPPPPPSPQGSGTITSGGSPAAGGPPVTSMAIAPGDGQGDDTEDAQPEAEPVVPDEVLPPEQEPSDAADPSAPPEGPVVDVPSTSLPQLPGTSAVTQPALPAGQDPPVDHTGEVLPNHPEAGSTGAGQFGHVWDPDLGGWVAVMPQDPTTYGRPTLPGVPELPQLPPADEGIGDATDGGPSEQGSSRWSRDEWDAHLDEWIDRHRRDGTPIPDSLRNALDLPRTGQTRSHPEDATLEQVYLGDELGWRDVFLLDPRRMGEHGRTPDLTWEEIEDLRSTPEGRRVLEAFPHALAELEQEWAEQNRRGIEQLEQEAARLGRQRDLRIGCIAALLTGCVAASAAAGIGAALGEDGREDLLDFLRRVGEAPGELQLPAGDTPVPDGSQGSVDPAGPGGDGEPSGSAPEQVPEGDGPGRAVSPPAGSPATAEVPPAATNPPGSAAGPDPRAAQDGEGGEGGSSADADVPSTSGGLTVVPELPEPSERERQNMRSPGLGEQPADVDLGLGSAPDLGGAPVDPWDLVLPGRPRGGEEPLGDLTEPPSGFPTRPSEGPAGTNEGELPPWVTSFPFPSGDDGQWAPEPLPRPEEPTVAAASDPSLVSQLMAIGERARLELLGDGVRAEQFNQWLQHPAARAEVEALGITVDEALAAVGRDDDGTVGSRVASSTQLEGLVTRARDRFAADGALLADGELGVVQALNRLAASGQLEGHGHDVASAAESLGVLDAARANPGAMGSDSVGSIVGGCDSPATCADWGSFAGECLTPACSNWHRFNPPPVPATSVVPVPGGLSPSGYGSGAGGAEPRPAGPTPSQQRLQAVNEHVAPSDVRPPYGRREFMQGPEYTGTAWTCHWAECVNDLVVQPAADVLRWIPLVGPRGLPIRP